MTSFPLERHPVEGLPSYGALLRGLTWAAALACLAAVWGVADLGVPGGEGVLGTSAGVGILVGVALVLLLGDLGVVRLWIDNRTQTFTASEMAVMLALAVAPAPWVVLLALPGAAVASLLTRRGLRNTLTNASTAVTGMGMLWALLAAVGHPGHLGFSPGGLWLLGLSGTFWALWSNGTLIVLTAARTRAPVLAVARRLGPTAAFIGAGNVIVGAVILELAAHRAAAFGALVPGLVFVYVAYRGHLSVVQQREDWLQLDAANRSLSKLAGVEVAEAAARSLRDLLRVDAVDVQLADGRSASATDPDAEPVQELTRDRLLEAARRVDPTVDETTLVHVPGAGQFLVVPLLDNGRPVGQIRLHVRELDKRQQRLLTAVSATVTACLVNAALHEQVRGEMQRQAFSATHDALTGLANRVLLAERAEQYLSRDDGKVTALLMMDLDHFKEINDTLGHKAGDELLVQVATRLADCVDARGLTARLGGDEFAILLPRLPSPAAADRMARQLLAALAAPLRVEGVPLSVEASIGVATAPDDGATVTELLKNADIALYKAKEARGSFRHFNGGIDDADRTRLTLTAELREAIETDQLELYYQPQRRLVDGQLVGVEALARWHHPVRGLLAPEEFVGVAESSGLIRAFTRWVLEDAAARAAAWRAAGHRLTVGVNLSARNLQDAALPADVAAVLTRHRLPPDALVLEVTETTVVSEIDVVEDVLASLRLLGVPLSLDDFGTGYSSLGVLRRLALSELKIDRSLVEQVLAGGEDLAIVRATVELAHALGLQVVAEGVADAATQAALTALGCDIAQGWHLGLPMAAAGIDALLAEERRPVVPPQADRGRAAGVPGAPRRRPRPVA